MLSLRGSERIAVLLLRALCYGNYAVHLFIKENSFSLFLSEFGLPLCWGDVSVLFSEVVSGLVKRQLDLKKTT